MKRTAEKALLNEKLLREMMRSNEFVAKTLAKALEKLADVIGEPSLRSKKKRRS